MVVALCRLRRVCEHVCPVSAKPAAQLERGEQQQQQHPYLTAEALERADILDWQAVLSQFNREDFLRDGYCALRRVFTAGATRRLLESCKRVQALNDEWLDHDWHEPTQWEHLGLQPPSVPPLSDENKNRARGGCQLSGGLVFALRWM